MSRWRTGRASDRRSDDLNTLLLHARENETTMRRFQSYELKLMSASDIRDCVRLLLSGSQRRFDNDAASVVLVDRDHTIARGILSPDSQTGSVELPDGLQLVEDESLILRMLDGARTPRLGPYEPHKHDRFFNPQLLSGQSELASVALVPFVRGFELNGCLALASRDPQRYQTGSGTDFLSHLGAVASVSIEAVVTRHQLRTLGLTDALTGVSNRRFFDQRLHEENGRARRESVPLSLVFIDIDHFKKVNDVGGHSLGDRVLRDVAAAVLGQVRMFDVVSRFGGDEFAVLLIGASRSTAEEIAERIRRAVEVTGRQHASVDVPAVTASIGIATVDRTRNLDADSLLECADRAVYIAKASGRNQLVVDREETAKNENVPPYLYQ